MVKAGGTWGVEVTSGPQGQSPRLVGTSKAIHEILGNKHVLKYVWSEWVSSWPPLIIDYQLTGRQGARRPRLQRAEVLRLYSLTASHSSTNVFGQIMPQFLPF